jgi:glycerol uptake facilitator-like aquaporin
MHDRREAPYVAEFLGTLLLVFFIGVVVVLQGPNSDSFWRC